MNSKRKTVSWRGRLRKWLPSADDVRKNRFVAWVGPAIYHPRLWHINRHGIAAGLAIGIFFGVLIPFLQIPIVALVAVWLRANMLAAVGSTLITNPITFPPIYFFAYQLGALLTGNEPSQQSQKAVDMVAQQASGFTFSTVEKFFSVGKPLMLGLGIMAVVGAILGYLLVLGAWRILVLTEWRRRSRR